MERMDLARMEGDSAVSQEVEVPCPEVAEKPVRRRFTAEYNRKILAKAEGLVDQARWEDVEGVGLQDVVDG